MSQNCRLEAGSTHAVIGFMAAAGPNTATHRPVLDGILTFGSKGLTRWQNNLNSPIIRLSNISVSAVSASLPIDRLRLVGLAVLVLM